jgi:hypothetical protein
MKSFGRLLMAAALIVPLGVATATHAGAASDPGAGPDNVTCTTNTGSVHFNPGISLTTKHGSTVTSVVDGTLDSCTGIGITDSTGAGLRFSVRSAPVTCKSIKSAVLTGKGSIRWNTGGSNEGIITPIKLKITFKSLTTIGFTGMVRGTGYLGQGKIRGTATVPPDLRSAGDNDGKCGNSKASRVHKLDYTNSSDFTINIPA